MHLIGQRLVLERQQAAVADAEVLTADRAWTDLDLPVRIRLLR